MTTGKNQSEKGQILVIIVLVLVVLLSFTALVVDGGMIFSNRRIAQNAADAAAYAGSTDIAQKIKSINNLDWDCETLRTNYSNFEDAANDATGRADDNDLVIDGSTAQVDSSDPDKIVVDYGLTSEGDNNGIEIICANEPEEYIDVHVRLTAPVETSFMHFANTGQVINTVDSVVRVRPSIIFGDGAAIIATRDSCENVPGPSDGGVTLDGTIDVDILDGGIRSNHCCNVNGNSNEVDIVNGNWTCNGTITLHPDDPLGNNLDPDPVPGPDVNISTAMYEQQLTAACQNEVGGSYSDNLTVNTDMTITEGKYGRITVNNNKTLTLTEGLYCLSGDFDIKGIVIGQNVTIFMPADASGDGGMFLTSASSSVTLSAPPVGCEFDTPGCAPAVGGLLVLYMPDDVGTGNTPRFVLTGNSTSNYEGTILVPNTVLNIAGGGDVSSVNRVQLVAETILFNGNGTINIQYDPDLMAQSPSFMNLQR